MKKIVALTMSILIAVTFMPGLDNMVMQEANAATKKLALKSKTAVAGVSQQINIKKRIKKYKKKAKYIYKSSNKKIVTVSKKGIATGKKVGNAKITITQKYKGKKSKAVIKFSVKKCPIFLNKWVQTKAYLGKGYYFESVKRFKDKWEPYYYNIPTIYKMTKKGKRIIAKVTIKGHPEMDGGAVECVGKHGKYYYFSGYPNGTDLSYRYKLGDKKFQVISKKHGILQSKKGKTRSIMDVFKNRYLLMLGCRIDSVEHSIATYDIKASKLNTITNKAIGYRYIDKTVFWAEINFPSSASNAIGTIVVKKNDRTGKIQGDPIYFSTNIKLKEYKSSDYFTAEMDDHYIIWEGDNGTYLTYKYR